MENPKLEDKSLNSESSKKTWRSRFSSHSGTLLFSGSIILGFIIAWRYGGFPSILLFSFVLLAFSIAENIFNIICKSTPKKNIEAVLALFSRNRYTTTPLREIFLLVTFYLIFAWCFWAIYPFYQVPDLNNVLRKVEFPFSEASHVVADSRGSVYVYSQFNQRIQKYSKEGRFQFGWFASKWKNSEMAIDENDFIYTYGDYPGGSIYRQHIIRKYDSSGNLIDEMRMRRTYEGSGWWRFKEDSVIWDPNAEKPRRYNSYNTAVKETELMPASELSKQRAGLGRADFRTKTPQYYELKRLWCLFPVVSVYGHFSDYIMPNPLSSTFTFVFPGLLFYTFAIFVGWVLEKRAERLTKKFLLKAVVTVFVIVITFAAIAIGSKIMISIANALPKTNPMHFWLVLIVVIPYWLVVIIAAIWTWRSLVKRLDKTAVSTENAVGEISQH